MNSKKFFILVFFCLALAIAVSVGILKVHSESEDVLSAMVNAVAEGNGYSSTIESPLGTVATSSVADDDDNDDGDSSAPADTFLGGEKEDEDLVSRDISCG